MWRSQHYVTLPRQEVLWLVAPAVPINPVSKAELVVSVSQLRREVGGDLEGSVTQQPAGKACSSHEHLIQEWKPSQDQDCKGWLASSAKRSGSSAMASRIQQEART